MSDDLWITRIFDTEFGFSDVRSKYSRVYSWMANQLGHLTLGIGGTVLFAWIVDSFEETVSGTLVPRFAADNVPAIAAVCALTLADILQEGRS